MIPAHPWLPDNGDGTYSNPVIHADYSDPDVIRVGDDYWMTASSFNCTPGLPILHSKDLVNWTLVNHAIRDVPHPSYASVRAGCGVWAPAIRHHGGKFWIVFPMPDEGIFATCADDPAGSWEDPWCIQEAKGWIDPCPFWDDDGQAYLAHAYAFSRSGLKERIHLRPMTPDCRRLLGEGRELFHTPHHLYLEGPKLHKQAGWYYVMCPGGGVQTGWQVAFRSRNLWGPYEEKVVLEQGDTLVNGPHQGAFIDARDGSWWFIHFQDRGVFGRIVHLQPVEWKDGWPLCGEPNGDLRQPVLRHRKPVNGGTRTSPATSDEFTGPGLGLQWQWHANHEPRWCSLSDHRGHLRLFPGLGNACDVSSYPRFLGQKFPAASFQIRTTLDMSGASPGSIAGLAVVGGGNSHFAGLRRSAQVTEFVLGTPTAIEVLAQVPTTEAQLVVRVQPDGGFCFETPAGARKFEARQGGWIGAKAGLFHMHPELSEAQGHADFGAVEFRG